MTSPFGPSNPAIVPVVGSLSHWMSLLVWAHKRKRHLFGIGKCLKTWNDVFKCHRDETECTAKGSSLHMLKAFAQVSHLWQVDSVRGAWFNKAFFLSFGDWFMKLIATRVFSIPLLSWQYIRVLSRVAIPRQKQHTKPGSCPALPGQPWLRVSIVPRLPVSLAWTARQRVPEPAASSTDSLRASFLSLVLSDQTVQSPSDTKHSKQELSRYPLELGEEKGKLLFFFS